MRRDRYPQRVYKDSARVKESEWSCSAERRRLDEVGERLPCCELNLRERVLSTGLLVEPQHVSPHPSLPCLVPLPLLDVVDDDDEAPPRRGVLEARVGDMTDDLAELGRCREGHISTRTLRERSGPCALASTCGIEDGQLAAGAMSVDFSVPAKADDSGNSSRSMISTPVVPRRATMVNQLPGCSRSISEGVASGKKGPGDALGQAAQVCHGRGVRKHLTRARIYVANGRAEALVRSGVPQSRERWKDEVACRQVAQSGVCRRRERRKAEQYAPARKMSSTGSPPPKRKNSTAWLGRLTSSA